MAGVVAGVDPGQKGAIVMLGGDHTTMLPLPFDREKGKEGYDYDRILIWLYDTDLVVIEKVTQPASLVRNQATLVGICIGIGKRYETVRPQVWRKHHGIADGTGKVGAMEKLLELRPELYAMADEQTRKGARPPDGMTDAALIAMYGQEVFGENV